MLTRKEEVWGSGTETTINNTCVNRTILNTSRSSCYTYRAAVVLLLISFTDNNWSVLQVYPSGTLSIKNLEGSATWKKVNTISFGDGLLVQLHDTLFSSIVDRGKKNHHLPLA